MVLVDTSVWIDHLRSGEPGLVALLEAQDVLMHPMVVGELACGNLLNRQAALSLLQDLPTTPVATNDEVRAFIEMHQLMGKGIGIVDAHLLAATALHGTARLWTRDRALREIADSIGWAWPAG